MGLSTSDIQVIEKTLAAGKSPRVVFTDVAGQIAGQVGKVMRLGEPAEGDFVTVRFGHDELPFSAAEVRLPGRGELSRSRKASKPQEAAPPVQGPPPPQQRHNSDDDSRNRSAQMNDPHGTAAPHPATAPAPDAVKPAPRKKAAARSKGGPELTVTLEFRDEEWTVAAAKGSKVVARPVPVKPSLAVTMVRSLESPAVTELVEEIVEQARANTAAEAERLRAQLAELEARLAELN